LNTTPELRLELFQLKRSLGEQFSFSDKLTSTHIGPDGSKVLFSTKFGGSNSDSALPGKRIDTASKDHRTSQQNR